MTFKKDDSGKLKYNLLPVRVTQQVIRVLMLGGNKYGDDNWLNGTNYSRYYNACKRHIDAWWMGEECDKESGLHHLAHAICCLIFLLYFRTIGNAYDKFDDRRFQE